MGCLGTGKSFRYLAAHEMAKALGPDRCTASPMFHGLLAVTRTVSSFFGRGKKSAWNTWMNFDDVDHHSLLYALAATPGTVLSKIGCKFLSDLWYCCMTALAARNQSIRHTHSCSPRKVELSMDSPHTCSTNSYSTQRGLPANAGDR